MIVALNGPPGVGKSEFARSVCGSNFNPKFWRLDLSYPFKRFVADCFGNMLMSDFEAHKDDPLPDRADLTLRQVCIKVADVLEEVDPEIWMRRALLDIQSGRFYVLDAVGKTAQWDLLRASGAHVVLVSISDGREDMYGSLKFSDNRDRIVPGLDDAHYSLVNIPPDQRTPDTLEAWHLTCQDLMEHVLG